MKTLISAASLPFVVASYAAVASPLDSPSPSARSAAVAPPDARPNIVLFISDDHGWRDSGCYGNKDVRTPNLDRLAQEGMRFTQAFAASPLCTPSRAVIETGLMPNSNGGHQFNMPIKPGLTTMPMYFKELGYYTAAIGKLHRFPARQFPYDLSINMCPTDPTARAVQFIKNYKNPKPMFLLVYSNFSHMPWRKNKTYDPATFTLPPNFVDTPQTRADLADYYTSIGEIDHSLGVVLKALDDTKMRDNTLFIYSTDQGANLPFAKWCVYDAGLHVPFIARWPGKVAAGATTSAMVSLADLIPTCMDAAAAKPPADLDGRSFLPVLTGKADKHRKVVFGSHTGQGENPDKANAFPARTLITPKLQYILNLHPERRFTCCINLDMSKSPQFASPCWQTWVEKAKTDPAAARIVNAYEHRPREELYDLAADPHEMKNLADDPKYAESRNDLRRQLADWCKQQNDMQPLEHLNP